MMKSRITYGSRERYQITKSFIPIIQKVGGYIFGGAVRDFILHDHAADEFYEASQQSDEEGYGDAIYSMFECGGVGLRNCVYNIEINPDVLYQDEDYLPRMKDRFLVPTDIDCFMTTSSLDRLKSKLQEKSEFTVRIRRNGLLRIYIPDIDVSASNLQLTRLEVTPQLPAHLRKMLNIYGDPTFFIDVVHASKINGLYPPFGNVDFECNSLLLTPTNDYIISPHLKGFYKKDLSPFEKDVKKAEIFEDIENKRAIVVSRVPLDRAKKMMSKNWEIIYYCDPLLRTSIADAVILTKRPIVDTKCSLCLEDFEEDGYRLKRPCCNAGIYHQKCWKTFMESDAIKRCPMCRMGLEEFELCDIKTVNLW